MASAAHTLPVAFATYDSLLSGLFGKFAALRARFARWRLFRRTLAELSALDRRELDDLGLPYGDLPNVAWQAVYGAKNA